MCSTEHGNAVRPEWTIQRSVPAASMPEDVCTGVDPALPARRRTRRRGSGVRCRRFRPARGVRSATVFPPRPSSAATMRELPTTSGTPATEVAGTGTPRSTLDSDFLAADSGAGTAVQLTNGPRGETSRSGRFAKYQRRIQNYFSGGRPPLFQTLGDGLDG